MKEIKSIKIDDIIRCINRHVLTVMIEPEGSYKFNMPLRVVTALADCLFIMTDYDFGRVMKETNIEKLLNIYNEVLEMTLKKLIETQLRTFLRAKLKHSKVWVNIDQHDTLRVHIESEPVHPFHYETRNVQSKLSDNVKISQLSYELVKTYRQHILSYYFYNYN